MPSLAGSQLVVVSASTAASLVATAFTPTVGQLIVVKASTADPSSLTLNVPTDTQGNTYTLRKSDTTASHTADYIWTATAATASSNVVTVTAVGGGEYHSMTVERWNNATLAASPATNGTTTGTGAPSSTITTTAANSVVSWMVGDWAAVSPTGRTYNTTSATPTDEGVHDGSGAGAYVAYYAYQSAASAGSQTLGLTAPGGQTWTLLGIEILDAAAAPAFIPRTSRRRPAINGRMGRRRVAQWTPPQVTLPVPAIAPQGPLRRGPKFLIRKRPQAAGPVPAQSSVVAAPYPPSRARLRRVALVVRRQRGDTAPPVDQSTVPATATRRRPPLLQRRPKASVPTPVQATAVAPPWQPPAVLRAALKGTFRRRPAAVAPPVAPQTVVPPPWQPQGVLRGAVKGTLRRRPAAVVPVPLQAVVPPSFPPLGPRLRRLALVVRRQRGDVTPPLDQVSPPAVPHVRRNVAPPRRRALSVPVPPQAAAPAAPLYPPAATRVRRTITGRPRPGTPSPVPPQQAAPTPPAYPIASTRARRAVIGCRRPGTPSPVPSQQGAAPAPPYPPWLARVRRTVTGQRRPTARTVIPPQAPAPQAAARPTPRRAVPVRRPRTVAPATQQAAPPPATPIRRATRALVRRAKATTGWLIGFPAPPVTHGSMSSDPATGPQMGTASAGAPSLSAQPGAGPQMDGGTAGAAAMTTPPGSGATMNGG